MEEASHISSHLGVHQLGLNTEGGQLRLHCRKPAHREQIVSTILRGLQEALLSLQ